MAKKFTLRLKPFENPNGTVSTRVEGVDSRGKYIRKNFRHAALAQAFLDEEEAKVIASPRPRARHTTLTEDQLRQAEAAIAALPEDAPSLIEVVFQWRSGARAPGNGQAKPANLNDLLWGYLEHCDRKGTKQTSIKRNKATILAFLKHAGIETTPELSKDLLGAFIRSYDNYDSRRTKRGILSGWCNWMVNHKEVLRVNPCASVEIGKSSRGVPGTLTLEQCHDLLTTAKESVMLGYFAVALLAGVRPDQVKRLNSWSYFQLEGEHPMIFVPDEHSKTTAHQVPVCAGLQRILTRLKRSGVENPCYFTSRTFNRVREKAGVVEAWCNDVLRHTFASYHFALHRNYAELEAVMGTSKQMLVNNYIAPKSPQEAERLFS